MAIVEGMESWMITISVEVENEYIADAIYEAIQHQLNEQGHTQWSAKMYRDLNTEKALEVFREHKEEILEALPDEVVAQYYPDRVSQGKESNKESHLSIVPELEEE
tara:strand:- start:861 stop:1178 length:318 start_codon:yes stop_codon:yes gene_type:complete